MTAVLTHLQLRYDKQDVNYRDITPIFVGLWRNQKISVWQKKTYRGASRSVAAQLSKHVAPHCGVLYQLKDEAEFSPADQPACMRVCSSKRVYVCARVAACRQESEGRSLTPSVTLERNNSYFRVDVSKVSFFVALAVVYLWWICENCQVLNEFGMKICATWRTRNHERQDYVVKVNCIVKEE